MNEVRNIIRVERLNKIRNVISVWLKIKRVLARNTTKNILKIICSKSTPQKF